MRKPAKNIIKIGLNKEGKDLLAQAKTLADQAIATYKKIQKNPEKYSAVKGNILIKILNETKRAVQLDIVNKPPNSGFVYVVKVDGETYVLHIEKYISANQLIENNISLLTKV